MKIGVNVIAMGILIVLFPAETIKKSTQGFFSYIHENEVQSLLLRLHLIKSFVCLLIEVKNVYLLAGA